jgi:hypothetical protein
VHFDTKKITDRLILKFELMLGLGPGGSGAWPTGTSRPVNISSETTHFHDREKIVSFLYALKIKV